MQSCMKPMKFSKRGLPFFRKRPEEVSVRSICRFICDHRTKFHVNRMCRALSVNERGYYKWLNNGGRPKKWQPLIAEIHRILDEEPDNDNYGADRMLIALTQRGIMTSLSSVRRAILNFGCRSCIQAQKSMFRSSCPQ